MQENKHEETNWEKRERFHSFRVSTGWVKLSLGFSETKNNFSTGHLRQKSKWHLRWRVLTFDEVWCPRVICSYGRRAEFLQKPVKILHDPSSQYLRSTVLLRASYSELYKSRLRREVESGVITKWLSTSKRATVYLGWGSPVLLPLRSSLPYLAKH